LGKGINHGGHGGKNTEYTEEYSEERRNGNTVKSMGMGHSICSGLIQVD